jgi:hypothetical protein
MPLVSDLRRFEDFFEQLLDARLQAAVPGVFSIAAPATIPNRTDLASGHPRLRPGVIAAIVASPAPTPLPLRIETPKSVGFHGVSQAAHRKIPTTPPRLCATTVDSEDKSRPGRGVTQLFISNGPSV